MYVCVRVRACVHARVRNVLIWLEWPRAGTSSPRKGERAGVPGLSVVSTQTSRTTESEDHWAPPRKLSHLWPKAIVVLNTSVSHLNNHSNNNNNNNKSNKQNNRANLNQTKTKQRSKQTTRTKPGALQVTILFQS